VRDFIWQDRLPAEKVGPRCWLVEIKGLREFAKIT
jgi:hypothetical protein